MKRLIALLLLAVMFTAGLGISCISVDISDQAPLIKYFVANPPTLTAGGSSTLSWDISGATSVSIDQGIGNVSLTGTRTVMPNATTIYTLTATNAAGASTTATTYVVVTETTSPTPTTTPMPTPTPIPTPTPTLTGSPPVINYFVASPSNISAGNSTTLSWNVSNATSVSINKGVGSVGLSGSTTVWPGTSTEYILTATNAYGVWTNGVTVLVSAAPATPTFTVTNVTASVEPPFYSGTCPTTFNSYAVITANGPGMATYRWEDSEGGIKPTENVYFSSAGSKSVSTSWPLGGTPGSTYSLWVRLHVRTPNETFSNQANFTLSCASASSGSWTGTWSTTFGQMQLSQTGNQVTGFYEHDNGQITGTATGNVLYGTWAEEPTYSAANNDAGDVELTLSPDGNSFTGHWKHGSSGGWYGSWNGTRIY